MSDYLTILSISDNAQAKKHKIDKFLLLTGYPDRTYKISNKELWMKLENYVHERGLSAERFASELGCTTKTVYRYFRGERIPEARVMTQIFDLTDGKVRPDDFYALPDMP